MTRRWLAVWMIVTASGAVQGSPPAYDHVVVVVEENRSFNQIIGSPDAAFIGVRRPHRAGQPAGKAVDVGQVSRQSRWPCRRG